MLEVEELYDGLSMDHREQAILRWGKERILKGEEYRAIPKVIKISQSSPKRPCNIMQIAG
jgi:hypothetical protein